MIYHTQGYLNNKLQEVKTNLDDFEAIRQSKIQLLNEIEKVEQYKQNEVLYFIAGKFKGNIRNNKNLIHKSLIVLDYDDSDLTMKQFIQHLTETIGRYKYYAYPSIRDGLKGLRYRLIIDIDRPYIITENVYLMAYVKRVIDLDEYDDSSKTYSQLQGLKCAFGSKEAYEKRCFFNEGEKLDVDECITLQKQWEKVNLEKVTRSYNKPNFTIKQTRSRTFTAKFLEQILQPIENGERNLKMTSLIGKFFALGVEANSVYEWAHLVNDYSVKPRLEEEEVNTIFKSILKAEKRRLEKGG